MVICFDLKAIGFEKINKIAVAYMFSSKNLTRRPTSHGALHIVVASPAALNEPCTVCKVDIGTGRYHQD